MATLAENAAAVKAAQVAIDAAIVAKGGTTTGGLANAAAAIAEIPSGGEDAPPGGWMNDGNTHLWIEASAQNSNTIILYNNSNKFPRYNAVVEWGDGSSLTVTNSYINHSHTYSTSGDYVITIRSQDMTFLRCNNGSETGNTYSILSENEYNPSGTLKYVELSDKITDVVGAFANSVMLKGVKGTSSVKYIGGYTFFWCQSLVNIEGMNYVERIANNAFYKCSYDFIGFSFDHVTSIGSNAFSDDKRMQGDVSFPAVTSLGNRIFGSSNIVNSLDLSASSLSTIPTELIYNNNINVLKLPATLTSLPVNAVRYGSGLRELWVYATVPPSIETTTFTDAPTKIFVPAESVDAYKAATNWSAFASKISAIPEEYL